MQQLISCWHPNRSRGSGRTEVSWPARFEVCCPKGSRCWTSLETDIEELWLLRPWHLEDGLLQHCTQQRRRAKTGTILGNLEKGDVDPWTLCTACNCTLFERFSCCSVSGSQHDWTVAYDECATQIHTISRFLAARPRGDAAVQIVRDLTCALLTLQSMMLQDLVVTPLYR